MIAETIINFDAIMPYLICLAGFIILGIIIFLLHNLGGLKLFSNHDINIVDKFLSKYPDVAPEFMKKTLKEQNIENNQEIHEINKRFDKNDCEIIELKETLNKIVEVLEEIQKNG